MDLNGEKAWFFHGDVFDVTMKYSKWLARLGAIGYDTLIIINTVVNWVANKFGKGRISLSKKIKNSVKSAVKFIDDFEETAAGIAIDNQYDYVVCGHIHQAQKRTISTENGSVMYLNSGDWIENLTALEFTDGLWTLFRYEDGFIEADEAEVEEEELETDMLFQKLMAEFKMMKAS